jgi:hypothetical protein
LCLARRTIQCELTHEDCVENSRRGAALALAEAGMPTLLPGNTPLPGDLLITSEGRRYLLSVIPQDHRLAFGDWFTALEFAMRSSIENNADVWCALEGEIVCVFRGRRYGSLRLRPTRDRRTALR